MKVVYINNDGAGFADTVDVAEGTTVGQFFQQRMGDRRTTDYLIRLNRLPCTADERLQEGARLSFTPVKIEGA